MNILLTGGTGLIGSYFIKKYSSQHTFTVTSRAPDKARRQLGGAVTVVKSVDEINNISAFDAVINLQGAGIADKRWSAQRKQTLQNSRWQVTEKLAEMIKTYEGLRTNKAFVPDLSLTYQSQTESKSPKSSPRGQAIHSVSGIDGFHDPASDPRRRPDRAAVSCPL